MAHEIGCLLNHQETHSKSKTLVFHMQKTTKIKHLITCGFGPGEFTDFVQNLLDI